MDNIVRNVRDIAPGDRSAIEHLVGHPLRDDQRLVIWIDSATTSNDQVADPSAASQGQLPEWCNVYEGLSETEIADLERSIVRSHESRSLA